MTSDECDTARNVGADVQLGRRRKAIVVNGRLARAARRNRNLTLTGSNAGVLWGSEVLGFPPTQLQAIRVDAAKATFRLSRGQNAATTVMAHAQAAGAKNVDPAFRHHQQVILAWETGVWEGTPDLDTMQAALRSALAWLSHLKGSWCGATDAAATFVLTLLRLRWSAQSARHLTTHDGTKIVARLSHLKAAACGAVLSNVLPGQTSRDGEDYAAAMAGHITLDPLTLHIDDSQWV